MFCSSTEPVDDAKPRSCWNHVDLSLIESPVHDVGHLRRTSIPPQMSFTCADWTEDVDNTKESWKIDGNSTKLPIETNEYPPKPRIKGLAARKKHSNESKLVFKTMRPNPTRKHWGIWYIAPIPWQRYSVFCCNSMIPFLSFLYLNRSNLPNYKIVNQPL